MYLYKIMKFLHDIPDIKEDLQYLTTKDSIFKGYDIKIANLPWKMFEPGFEGLTRTLQSQQISYKVADTLWVRLKELSRGRVTPEFFLSLDDRTLKYTGFTRQKSSYMKGVCELIIRKEFNPNDWDSLSDDEAVKKITDVKGFGLWSAQVFMLFSLGRRNILPAKDLVVDRAIQQLFQLDKRPDYDEAKKLATPWNDRLSAATLLLWHLYIEKRI